MSEKSDTQPIPREFYSEYEERPFKTCSRCGESLASFENYQINKAYRNSECVVEFALCAQCRDKMFEEFSEESKQNLTRHQQDNMLDTNGIESCCFCGQSPSEVPMKDYIITALCEGVGLLDSVMICFPCQEKMLELLSEHTKDVRRRFYEELPGVPPDWEPWPEEEKIPSQPLNAVSKARASKQLGPHIVGHSMGSGGGEVPRADTMWDLVWESRPWH